MAKIEKILETKSLTKVFSVGSRFLSTKIVAVENVSFYIRSAEIFTLAGESGCGKTTTAKIILGIEEPTAGEIIFKGKPASIWRHNRGEFMRQVQPVFQNPFETFNPLRTVDDLFFETVYNYNPVQDKDKAVDLITEKLMLVGLSFGEIRSRYPSELSGGQLQRASIARALLTNPSLLIADEPVSMVDASLRMSIINLFKDLKKKLGLSIFYITHDLATAYHVSDRIAIMFRGNIMETGPVEVVLTEPKHPYTQLLKDSIPEPDPEKKWSKQIKFPEIEHEEYLRSGCKFAGRCPLVMDKCKSESPKEVRIGSVTVRCHKYEQR